MGFFDMFAAGTAYLSVDDGHIRALEAEIRMLRARLEAERERRVERERQLWRMINEFRDERDAAYRRLKAQENARAVYYSGAV